MNSALKLLLLEDEIDDVELIQRFLSRSGLKFESVIASDKSEFKTAIKGNIFDAILADNSLPQFSSIDALRCLHELDIDTPFILVTGAVSEEFAVDIIHKGADDYILKNNLARLPASITRAIEKRKSKREKLAAEKALVKSEKRYRTLFQRNLAGIYQSSMSGEIIDCNIAFCKMLGFQTAAELRQVPAKDLYFSDDDRNSFISRLQNEKHLFNYEVLLKQKNGDPLYALENISLIDDDCGQIIEGIIINITERKKAEDELRQTNLELRELSSHLQNVREEERIQIARDIHDELGQQLTGLLMAVHFLTKKIPPDDDTARAKYADILALIEQIVKSVRTISTNLRPNVLDDFGLIEALKWQSREVEARFGIKIIFTSDFPEMEIPAGISTGLFRIYQEALTNAVRHANAHIINGSLRIQKDKMILEIKDDGKGIDMNAGPKKKSFGLLGIKERVFVLNGHYELKSKPGEGTHLTISVPL